MKQEHAKHITTLTAFMRPSSAQDIPCPKKFLHAMNNGKMLIETGVLDPLGEEASLVYEAMSFVEKIPLLLEIAKKCKGCNPDG